MIKGVIFDMDGVIIDSEILYLELIDQFLKEIDCQVSQTELEKMVGISIQESENLLYSWIEKSYPNREEAEKAVLDFLNNSQIDYQKILLADAKWLIEKLKEEGYILALASSAQRKVVDEVLAANQLTDFFLTTFCGDEVEVAKPNPEIYYKTIEKMGLKAEEVIIIEDSMPGLEAANQTGATVIARKSPHFDHDLEADYIVDDLRLVHGILSKLSPKSPIKFADYCSKDHLKSLFLRKELAGKIELPDSEAEKDALIMNYERDQQVLITLVAYPKDDLLDIQELAYREDLEDSVLEEFLASLLQWMGENKIEHLGLKDDRALALLQQMIMKRMGEQNATR